MPSVPWVLVLLCEAISWPKMKKKRLASSYAKKKREIISKSILEMNKTFNTKDIVTFGYPSTGSIDNKLLGSTNVPSVKNVASPMYTPWKQQDEETIKNRMNILRRKKRAGQFIR